MAKTPEEVIAKLQRRIENTGRHITGLIDSLDQAVSNVVEAIEAVIPTRIRREREKRAPTA